MPCLLGADVDAATRAPAGRRAGGGRPYSRMAAPGRAEARARPAADPPGSCLDLTGGAAENGAVSAPPRPMSPPRSGRFQMSFGTQLRAALAVLASVLLAVAAPGSGDAKTLRTNLRADPAMVDPVTYSELVAGDVMKNLYEGFTEMDKDGNVVPALALKWEA